MRICSFLPSATEILYALGLGESVAGITYECDYPAEARQKPVVVNTRLPRTSKPAEIDRLVNESMARHESLYQIEMEALRAIQPELIITQDLCHVCAASPGDLASALSVLPRPPEVLSLNPHTLEDVWNDIRAVGKATGRAPEAERLVKSLEERVARVEQATGAQPRRPRVLCLEWLDPPFIAGHWVPEMVARAGGSGVMGRVGEPGFRTTWDKLLGTEAEIVVLMPCGYHLKEVVEEFKTFRFPAGWDRLPAVQNERVFAVDASSYFSRPGPRLAIGVEALGRLLHPERVRVELPNAAMAALSRAGTAARI